MSRTVDSSMMVLTASHSSLLRVEMVGLRSAGSALEDGGEFGAAHVHHETHLAQRRDGPLQQHGHVLELAPLVGVLPRREVGDELRVRLQHGVDDAQLVGPQRAARFRDLHDGVGKLRRLDLRGAPAELTLA